MTKLAPIAILALSGLSCIVYAIDGDWRRALYWLGAVIINVAVML